MSYTMKPFEELDIMDDFLTNAIANDEEVREEFFKTLLSVLLQRKIGKIRVNAQHIIPANIPTHRGIRLDVEVIEYDESDVEMRAENIYDIEPHKKNNIHLPKHNRFYQAKIDGKNMKSGDKDFTKLPNLFVLTITNYDPFGYNYMMYTIHNYCEEIPELVYEDGLCFIYFNTKGIKGGTAAIKNLLNYIQESKIENVIDEATRKLHTCISKVKIIPEVRMEYMTLEEKISDLRLDAREEGKAEGKAEDILELLMEYGEIAEHIKQRILEESDLNQLRKWLKLAAKVDSIQTFVDNM